MSAKDVALASFVLIQIDVFLCECVRVESERDRQNERE